MQHREPGETEPSPAEQPRTGPPHSGPAYPLPGLPGTQSAPLGIVASALATVRLVAGWAAAALAVLDIAMGLNFEGDSTDLSYLVFHLVLLATGVVLLAWGHLHEHPGRVGLLTGGLVAGLGLVLSALPSTTTVCCLLEQPVRHGYPFTLLARGSDGWHVDGALAAANLIFWTCAGFLALSLVGLIELHRDNAMGPRHASHAEHRATARHAHVPRHENVGGVP